MFFSSPSLDLEISLILLGLSFLFSIIIFILKRNWALSLVWFSVLGNLSFLVNIYSGLFVAYNLIVFSYFVFIFWPLINISLIVYYVYKFKKK